MLHRLNLSTAILIAVACLDLTPPSAAHAENRPVTNRLKDYGELSEAQSRALIKAVSKRMKRASTHRAAKDPVRLSVKHALAAESRSARRNDARVRRRLRAGLDLWALEHLFAPRPAAFEHCGREFRLSSNLCESLLAAGGGISIAGVQAIGEASAARVPPAHELTSAKAPAAPSPQAPMARVAAPRRDQDAPSKAVVARKKREYERQRAAYLERKRQEVEARKARIIASAGPPVQRGPASAMEAELIGLPPAAASEVGARSADQKTRAKKTARTRPKRTDLAGTDGELADTLVHDPLGKREIGRAHV